MGKRKDRESTSEDAKLSSPKKKHKHKHKKHKKRREGEEEVQRKDKKKDKTKNKDRDKHEPEERSLKIKIKFGGQTFTTKQVPAIVPVVTSEEEEVEIENEVEDTKVETNEVQSYKTYQEESVQEMGSEAEEGKKKASTSDHEEEEWLNALEAGELDDYGRLKQEKDISTMTARQRAMHGHEIEGENQLLELPTETRRKDEDSEEAQKKRKQRAKKRKQQMQKQIEDNKAQTVKKLLERETTRAKKDEEKARKQKAKKPNIRYISGNDGFSLSYPPGMDFPFHCQKLLGPPKPKVKCKAKGCTNDKKYNCSSNNIPVCSLKCYKLVKSLPTSPVAV